MRYAEHSEMLLMYEAIQGDIADALAALRDLLVLEQRGNEGNQILRSLGEKLGTVDRKFAEKSLRIAIIALTKAGKSTLLNAWLGAKFLPDSNTPETARIVRIRHTPESPDGVLFDAKRRVASGSAPINTYLRAKNAEMRKPEPRDTGQAPIEDELRLDAPLVALAGLQLESFGFEILDTPGPNEAGTEKLRAKVTSLLNDVDVIVYLLDYTRLKTSAEEELFRRLAEMRPELLCRYSNRLFFAVNRIDEQNSSGLTPEETTEYVADVLHKFVPSVAVTPDRILLVSAQYALLARLVENGRATDGEVQDFAKRAFGEFGAARQRRSLEDCREAAPYLLEKSCIAGLEDRILAFIYDQRVPLLVQSLLDDLERHLTQFRNYLETVKGTLTSDTDRLKEELTQLRRDLSEICHKTDRVRKKAHQVEAEVVRWVEDQFEGFSREVASQVSAALKGSVDTSGWRYAIALWRYIASGVSRLMGLNKESDQERIRREIRNVFAGIADYISQAFDEFRADFEQQLSERQAHLFEELEGEVNPLATLITEKVGETLDVKLQPVGVRLHPPAFNELHEDIERRVGDFIRHRKETVPEQRLVQSAGFCRKAKYEYTYTDRTTYSIALEDLEKYWDQSLRNMTATTVAMARHLIRGTVIQAIQKAKDEIEARVQGYEQSVEHEIREVEEGRATREQRLEEVAQRSESAERILYTVLRCSEALEPSGAQP